MTSAGETAAEASPWLCQGDLFSSAPVLYYPDLSQDLLAQLRKGPAMLITHDCALDKMNNRGEAAIERLSFVRIRDLTATPDHRQQLLRTNAAELQPFEAHYLGEVAGFGESYVLLSDPYYLPAGYFGVETRAFTGLPDGEKRLAITNHDTRFGRLGDQSLELFRKKWNAYWTRVVPDE